jgi:ABC-type lipoprotein release transport system permease subunit
VGAVALIAGHEVRRRGRRALALAILVGLLGAMVLAVVAGARRTGTALDRFRTWSHSADLELAVSGSPSAARLDALRRDPSIVAIADLRAFGLVVPHALDLVAIGAPQGPEFGTTVDRGRVIAGRAVDPNAPDELAIGESLATQLHLHVGDTLTTTSYSVAQIDAVLGGTQDVGPLAGPRVTFHIVGIVRRPLDLSDRAESGGFLVLSPAFTRAYTGRIGVFGSYLRIRTRGGAAGLDAATAVARKQFGETLFDTEGLAIETNGARDAVHVIAVSLWILGIVAALAVLTVLVQLLSRELAGSGAEYAGTRALGMTRAQRVAASAPFVTIVAAGGALIAAVGAVALSPLFPIGVARRAEPNLGVHVDWTVVPAGGIAIVGLLAIAGAIAAWRASRITSDRGSEVPRHAARAIDAIARSGCRPTVTSGLRLAVGAGPNRNTAAVRSAVGAAVLGVLGLTAASIFIASLDHLATTPKLYGATWDFKVDDVTANTRCAGSDFGLTRVAGITALSEVCSQNVSIDGRATPAVAYTTLRGDPIDPEVTAGRAPRAPDEIALGAETLRALHKRVGDDVTLRRNQVVRRDRIVGRVVLPTLGRAQPIADGATLTGAGYAPFFDRNLFTRGFVGRFAAAADRPAVEARLAAIHQIGPATGPTVAVEVARVHQVDWLPLVLGVLFGVLGLLAVAHALVTGVRRRGRDLAVLRALGFTRREVRAAIEWQAGALATIGLALGLPCGLLVGRLAWRIVAGDLGVASIVTVPGATLGLTACLTLAVVICASLLPARTASRIALANSLRSE